MLMLYMQKTMIKHLLTQILKKRRRYYISATVLFLSFFVLIVIMGFIYPDILKSSSLKLPVTYENRVELVLEWKTREREVQKSIMAKLEEEILKLNGVLTADNVLNDLGSIHTIHLYDDCIGNSYFIFCGENFNKVFDLKLNQGKWFSDQEDFSDKPPVVITRNHADYLGMQNITPNSSLTISTNSENKESTIYKVVGIVENIGNVKNLRSRNDIEENIFPVFSPISSYKNPYNFNERLILKMQEGYEFELLNTQILNLIGKMNLSEYVHQHRLTSLNDVLDAQVKAHFEEMRLFYGILIILLIYIFVALFGTFWKLTHKRIVEIGIRRAIGHSRLCVNLYILAEPVLLLLIVLLPATIVFLNLYKIIDIKSPGPVYLITTGILFLIVLLATLIPALYAARIHPVQALAEE